MGLLQIPLTMVSFSAFPLLIGIGIDYAIQFHNRIDEEFSKGVPPIMAAINTVNHVAIPGNGRPDHNHSRICRSSQLQRPHDPGTSDFSAIIGSIMCYLSALFVGGDGSYLGEKRSGSRKKRGRRQGRRQGGSSGRCRWAIRRVQ